MSHGNSDRNLLIGILALQMDFISRDQLVEAIHAWVLDKSQSLDDVLLCRQAIDGATRDLILALVEKHLQMHQGDAAQSLAAVSSINSSVREQLRSIGDAAVEASLALAPASAATDKEIVNVTTVDVGAPSGGGLRFCVLRPHARGGLGQVSVALDKELHREVALKEIQQQHANDPDSRSRFLMEAEITGGLEHPSIVPVYGMGTYSDGRPFYAMRFIRGDSLREAVDRFHKNRHAQSKQDFTSLEFRNLLGRFVDVCNAIEYAHSRGVLHRDLKPGNIMLGKYGETLVVDWGLSKVIGREDVNQEADEPALRISPGSGSAATQMGMALGTPAYMSPEQAAGRLDQLGPASDVYSLGATLYCLLIGKPPFQQQDVGELIRLVERGDFCKPRAANSAIPKPLEAICLKAMSRGASDRYASPQRLADEIEHWMADEPVEAYREPLSARTWRWVRRHQAQAAGAAAAALVGLLGLAIVSGVIANSNRELKEANQQLDEASKRLSDANQSLEVRNKELQAANDRIAAAETNAREERDVAAAINQFVSNDLLGQASPDEEPDRNVKLRTVLDRAAAAIGDRFADKPKVEAAIRHSIGHTFLDLGEFEMAQPHLERSFQLRRDLLGADDLDTLTSMNSLAGLYQEQGRNQEALPLFEETVAARRRVLGDEHPHTLNARHNLSSLYVPLGRFQDAERLSEDLLETARRVLDDEHPIRLSIMNHRARLHQTLGRYAEAEKLYLVTLETWRRTGGQEHPNTLTGMNNLASLYKDLGRYDEAEQLYQAALETKRRVLGAEHPGTLMGMTNLAGCWVEQNRFSEAEDLYERAIEAKRRVMGEEHSITLNAMNNLAALYKTMGRYQEAERIFAQLLETRKKIQGAEHADTLGCMGNLASLYREFGRHHEAEPLVTAVLEARRRLLGDEHPETLSSLTAMAALYQDQARYDMAEPIYKQVLETRQRVLGATHPDVLSSMNGLGKLYELQGRYDEATRLFEELVETERRVLGREHRGTLTDMMNLALVYQHQQRYDEAEQLYDQTLNTMRTVFGDEHPGTVAAMYNRASLDLVQGRYEQAESKFLHVLDIRRRVLGNDHPDTITGLRTLASLYRGQRQFDKAERYLEEAVKTAEDALGDDHLETLMAMHELGIVYWNLKKLDLSIPLYERLATIRRREFGDDHVETQRARANLAVNYQDADRHADALPLLEASVQDDCLLDEGYKSMLRARLAASYDALHKYDKAEPFHVEDVHRIRQRYGNEHGLTAYSLQQLGLNLLAQKKYPEAETVLRECLDIRTRILSGSWLESNAKSLLGAALAGQSRLAEAQPLLVESYEGLSNADAIPAGARGQLLADALRRIVDLYTAWDQPDEATKWQTLLDEHHKESKGSK